MGDEHTPSIGTPPTGQQPATPPTGQQPATPPTGQEPPATPPTGQEPPATPPTGQEPPATPPTGQEPNVPPQQQNPTNALVGISEELLKHERLAGVQSVEDLAKRLVEAKLAPEIPSPDKYVLPEGIPEQVREVAHSQGLSQSQLEGVIEQFAAINTAANESALTELMESGKAKLTEWGDNADANMSSAQKAVNHYEAKFPGLRDLLLESGYAHHPVVMDLFADVGKYIGEGEFVQGTKQTPAVAKTHADRMFPNQGN